MVNDKNQWIYQLELISSVELNQILYEWNDTEAAYPKDRCIHELFEDQVERIPDAIAVVYEEEGISYREMNRSSNQLAHYLVELGVKPDNLVGIGIERSLKMVIGILSILKAGGGYIPLDPEYPEDRLSFMLEDSAPMVVLTQTELRNHWGGIPVIELDHDAELWESCSSYNLKDTGTTPHNLGYVIYTSGSTGIPKGVSLTHGNAVNFILWAKESFGTEILDHTLFSTSLNFDLSIFECIVPLSMGSNVRIVRDILDLTHIDTDVTLINTVPSAMKALLEAGAVPVTTRVVNLAGEPLKKRLVERLFTDTDVEMVCNLYGPSETTTYSTWVRMNRIEGFIGHIGVPVANTRIYLLDTYGEPVPVGVMGEIYIGGEGVTRGYLKRPELTTERFLPDPFTREANARMYRTGDLARWLSDGNIEFTGRNDHQVKIRGYRIELGEIESRIREIGGIKDAVVVAREEETGDKRLVGYYTLTEDREGITAEEIRRHLSRQLPDYMVPSAYVVLDEIPLTPNGKTDRKALPAPEGGAYARGEYEAPIGEIEEILSQIWSEVLNVEKVGRNDNFFDLGGHSLLAVKLIERIRCKGLNADIRSLFTSKTMADMAMLIKHNKYNYETDIPANDLLNRFETVLNLSEQNVEEVKI
jgi:amino acid adenylation domain-containing protein